MAYKQLKSPNLNQKDEPGWCLRFVRGAFGIKSVYEYAWQSWQASKTKNTGPLPTDVAVPVWYEWTGTIDGVTRNWGDVAIHVPGKGVFGTPQRGSGKSNRWDKDVEARRKWLGGGAKYVGWTLDVNGEAVAQKLPDKPSQKWKVGDKAWLRADKWRIYKPGTKPVVGNEMRFIRPNDYNEGPNGQKGVIYTIKGTTPYANTFLIQTQMYGPAWIFLDKDATKV